MFSSKSSQAKAPKQTFQAKITEPKLPSDTSQAILPKRQFQTFIHHCATEGLKYEYIDVHFSLKDERALETNELIKKNGYDQAFLDFAEEAEDNTSVYHTYQRMRRINHHREGAPKVTPLESISMESSARRHMPC